MILDTGLPIVGYKFAVVIFTAGIPNPVDLYFQEVNGLEMGRDIEYDGNRVSLSGKKQAKSLTLKRGVFSGPSPLVIANALESLLWESYLVRKDILVSVLNENSWPVNAWFISQAYLKSWKWDNVNATSNDVLVETMEFSFRDIKFIPYLLPESLAQSAAETAGQVVSAGLDAVGL